MRHPRPSDVLAPFVQRGLFWRLGPGARGRLRSNMLRMPSTPIPTDQVRRARRAISAVFSVFGILFGSWLPHIPDVKLAIHCSDSAIGGALICSGFGAIVSMQVVGRIIHRVGTRRASLISGCGACVLLPLLVLHASIPTLCVNLFAIGLFYGVLDVAMNSHAVEVQNHFERPIMSSIHGWFSFGGILGGLTASLAARLQVVPFVHLVLTSILMLLVLAASYPSLLPHDETNQSDGPKFVIPHGVLLLLGLLCASAFVIEGGILDWSALYVRETLKADIALGGIATGCASGAMAVGRFFGDVFVQRLGNRAVVALGGVSCALGVLVAINTPLVIVFIGGICLACFGLSNVVPALFTEAGNVAGIPVGTGVAAVTTLAYGGFLIGPPAIGLVAQRISLSAGLSSLALLGILLALGSRMISARSLVSS